MRALIVLAVFAGCAPAEPQFCVLAQHEPTSWPTCCCETYQQGTCCATCGEASDCLCAEAP